MPKSKNIFDLTYYRNPQLQWRLLEDGIVELAMEHTGVFAAIAQKLFRRPRTSYIKLDELGSFVWLELEKAHDIQTVSEAVHEQFGEKAEPLLPRLGQFFNLLERYGFIAREEQCDVHRGV